MLFKILGKDEFERFIELTLKELEVIAPKKIGTNSAGKPLHQFLPVNNFKEIDLSYEIAEYSAKTYFLPYCENLSTYQFDDEGWEQHIRYRLQPRVILGLRPCDINALLKLDKVLARDKFPSPYYISRRKNTFIVGLDHDPCEGGFCKSMGTHVVTHGFDLFLTDIGDRYFVAIDSDRGFRALEKVNTRDINDEDTQKYLKVRQRIASGFKTSINTHNLPNLLDIEFESNVWKKWGDKCMSCGSCAMVCPTCYCYGVGEEVSMNFEEGTKSKHLYSCSLPDFATVTGGHNFRPDRETRLKYRYYHQHRGFAETYEQPMCVGCNRCGRVCLADINPADVIQDLLMEQGER